MIKMIVPERFRDVRLTVLGIEIPIGKKIVDVPKPYAKDFEVLGFKPVTKVKTKKEEKK